MQGDVEHIPLQMPASLSGITTGIHFRYIWKVYLLKVLGKLNMDVLTIFSVLGVINDNRENEK